MQIERITTRPVEIKDRDVEMFRIFRNRLQEFLQLNHSRSFSANYLSWYLHIPESAVVELAEDLILEGLVKHPEHTNYIVGIPVDWKAVHEGRTERPGWAVTR